MEHPHIIPGAQVKVVPVKYGDMYSLTHYLTSRLEQAGTTFGLGAGMMGLVLARVDDEAYFMVQTERWGTRFGWCDVLEGFETI